MSSLTISTNQALQLIDCIPCFVEELVLFLHVLVKSRLSLLISLILNAIRAPLFFYCVPLPFPIQHNLQICFYEIDAVLSLYQEVDRDSGVWLHVHWHQ